MIGHIFVSLFLGLTLYFDIMAIQIQFWLATIWNLNIAISLQITTAHGLLVISNKWVQGK